MRDDFTTVRGQSGFFNTKQMLVSYRHLNEEIDMQIERLETLRSKASAIGGGNLTGMPKASSNYDRVSDYATRIVDLESELDYLIEQRNQKRAYIESLIKRIDKVGERAVLRSRYLDCEDWEDVLFLLFGNKVDYDSKYENYKQRMFRLHRSAIINLSNLYQ